jgi:hypothetical protein
MLVGTLVLGLVSAPEPPKPGGSSEEAMLRVFSPEDKPYRIIWNYQTLEIGEADDGSDYKDYEVPPEAGSLEKGFNLALDRVENEAGEKWEGSLQAILFVKGEYATCAASGVPVVRIYWHPAQEPGTLLMRAVCGRYRYAQATTA